jgi:aspartokinase
MTKEMIATAEQMTDELLKALV